MEQKIPTKSGFTQKQIVFRPPKHKQQQPRVDLPGAKPDNEGDISIIENKEESSTEDKSAGNDDEEDSILNTSFDPSQEYINNLIHVTNNVSLAIDATEFIDESNFRLYIKFTQEIWKFGTVKTAIQFHISHISYSSKFAAAIAKKFNSNKIRRQHFYLGYMEFISKLNLRFNKFDLDNAVNLYISSQITFENVGWDEVKLQITKITMGYSEEEAIRYLKRIRQLNKPDIKVKIHKSRYHKNDNNDKEPFKRKYNTYNNNNNKSSRGGKKE